MKKMFLFLGFVSLQGIYASECDNIPFEDKSLSPRTKALLHDLYRRTDRNRVDRHDDGEEQFAQQRLCGGVVTPHERWVKEEN